jgi:hypothetical protein
MPVMRSDVPKSPYQNLASDARAGTFARRKARLDQRRYVRKNWRWLLGGYVGLVSVGLASMLFIDEEFVRGLVLGLAMAGGAGAMANTVVIQTGTGPTMAGELAEQWTAQELRPLQKHGYHLANHVDVDGRGDADHVLTGPGGLFVFETKWSASEWKADRFFLGPLEQVGSRARNTWLQVKRHGVESVTPVLVLWGRAATALETGTGVRKHGNTYVVAGHHLRRWMLGQAPGALTSQQVQAVHADIRAMAGRADKVAAPVPPSLATLYLRAAITAITAGGAFLAPLFLARFGLASYLISAVALAVTGALLVQRGARIPGIALVTGACASLAVGAVAFAVALSR